MAKSNGKSRSAQSHTLAEPLSDLSVEGTEEICESLRSLLADVFVLYVKTKNFHWHLSGPNFRDYHLMLDEQAAQIFAMTDDIAERARKLGGTTIHSIGEITRNQRIEDCDEAPVAETMLRILLADNQHLIRSMRETREICDESKDCGTISLLEGWIEESERRAWFLYQTVGADRE